MITYEIIMKIPLIYLCEEQRFNKKWRKLLEQRNTSKIELWQWISRENKFVVYTMEDGWLHKIVIPWIPPGRTCRIRHKTLRERKRLRHCYKRPIWGWLTGRRKVCSYFRPILLSLLDKFLFLVIIKTLPLAALIFAIYSIHTVYIRSTASKNSL